MPARSAAEQPSATEPPASVIPQQPPTDQIELTSVLSALSDPLRLDLVRELAECGIERTCGSFNLPIAKSTATHHWRILREAGVIVSREEGTKKYNRLRRDDLEQRFPGLLDSILAGAAATDTA
ncbi:helix-turn-helix transcriptional regulator [soil metagenome]